MAIFTSICGRASTFSLLVHVLVFIRLRANVSVARAATPGLYVFGDSLVDVGNNNYLPLSLAKADYRPNGVDYSGRKSTGRFSNGKNAADFLAKKMGLPSSPPYLSMIGMTPPITGVSFASGASGILNETGVNFVQYISLAQQVEYFTLVHNKLVQQLGQSGAQSHLSKSIFAVITGSNDLFSYFSVGSLVLSLVPKHYTPQKYVDLMVSSFIDLLKMLYGLGARKMVITGVGAIGCCPILRKANRTGECFVEMNYLSARYNDGLKIMLHELKSELQGMNYVYFDIHGVMTNLFQNPRSYGITEIKEACCGLGNLHADVPCLPTSTYCLKRKKHVFWDQYHPTEVTASIFVDILYNGTQEYVVPINVKQLLDV
ncbi:GDSL esterase/lipase-like protein [Tanacetum coccineum]